MKAAICRMKITFTRVTKKIIISKRPFHCFITIFLLSLDLSLSCKQQLIDLITVSAICLAGRQTILVCFFLRTVKWVHRKTKETNGWKIKDVTGRFPEQIHPSRFVSRSAIFSLLVLLEKMLPLVRSLPLSFALNMVPRMLERAIGKIFWGEHAPRPL